MGLISGLMGMASEVSADEMNEKFGPILAENEQVVLAYKEIRDMYVFTNFRLILVDKQGITGRKVDYHSIPYKSISHFSVETAGHFDLDAELRIWVSSSDTPIERELKGGSDVVGIQKTLAHFIFN
jgi:hypothetical protein